MTVDGPETDGDEAVRRYLRALDLRRAAPPGMRPDDTASALAAEVDDGDDGDDALAVLLAEGTPGSLGDLAPAFVAGAARYGKRHHVTCEGWLGAGVDPDVLAGAGIRPDR